MAENKMIIGVKQQSLSHALQGVGNGGVVVVIVW
jgi:hypothetical protein